MDAKLARSVKRERKAAAANDNDAGDADDDGGRNNACETIVRNGTFVVLDDNRLDTCASQSVSK